MKTGSDMRNPVSAPVRRMVFAALCAWTLVMLVGSAWGYTAPERPSILSGERADYDGSASRSSGIHFAQNKGRSKPSFDSFPPEERPRMQQQFREWQSLPPEQKDTMRRRMDEWNRMPPNQRDRYQQRYQQWQQLSPDERRQLENNLQRWDNLSPQERDSVRQRFRK
jgi:hypothetical protein